MKKAVPWIIVGLLLRLVLMPLSSHPDIRGHNLGGYIVGIKGQVLGIYDYISGLPREDPIVKIYHDDLFIYPPLAYLAQGLFIKVLSPVINWKLFEQLILDIGQARQMPGFDLLMFWLKLPYLIVDLVVLGFILRLVDKSQRIIASVLWAFNIPVIYSAYLLGQLDILMIAFMVWSLYLCKIGKNSWGAVVMGLAAGFKPFPFFLLPFLPGNKIKNVLLGGLTYLAIISPYLGSTGFRQYALLAPQSDKIWYAKIMVSGSQYLPLFIVGLVFLFWASTWSWQKRHFWEWPMYVLLLFYSVVHFHPQWFAWVTPFLILLLVSSRKSWLPVAVLLAAYGGVVLSFEPSLNFGLFGLNLNLAAQINNYYPADQLVSLLRGTIAGTSLAIGSLRRDV